MHRTWGPILVALLAVSLLSVSPQSAVGRPLNIVMLVSDDHVHTALGCAGNNTLKTPHLDRLAADGVRFTHFFSTNPICTPARASLLTGQHSWTNGVKFFGDPISPAAPLWPVLLRSAGYETYFIGKWHNDAVPSQRGFADGAEVFLGGMSDHDRMPLVSFDLRRRYTGQGFSSELLSDAAVAFLDQDRGDKPFCLYVSYTAPHDPRMPPGRYANMYDPDQIELPPNFLPRPAVELFTSEIRDEQLLPFPRDPAQLRREIALYYGMISHLDAQVGRVLDKLAERGLAQNTVVIFVGDQGLALGAHGVLGKQTLYEEGVRSPLVIRHPQLQRAGAECSELTDIVDLFPTVCAIAGVDVPRAVEGRSLLQFYDGSESAAPLREQVFAMYHNLHRSVRTERHKLIHHLKSGQNELFDLVEDPYELQNLSGKPEHAELERQLLAELNNWRKKIGDN